MKDKPTLVEYIEIVGEKEIATKYDVSIHTARSWKYRNRQPSIDQAKKIMRDTNLTWESIYGPIEEGVAAWAM